MADTITHRRTGAGFREGGREGFGRHVQCARTNAYSFVKNGNHIGLRLLRATPPELGGIVVTHLGKGALLPHGCLAYAFGIVFYLLSLRLVYVPAKARAITPESFNVKRDRM
jgi:hypothetical protein